MRKGKEAMKMPNKNKKYTILHHTYLLVSPPDPRVPVRTPIPIGIIIVADLESTQSGDIQDLNRLARGGKRHIYW